MMSLISWLPRLSSKEGMMFERPTRIVERTGASVTGAPLEGAVAERFLRGLEEF
jgi:hypothetical protein